jgi:hypothetical protein
MVCFSKKVFIMALFFSTTTDITYDVVITCDPALDMSEDEKSSYLRTGEGIKIKEGQVPTYFVIKPLSPKERENAELKAGAYTRSELGRILWSEEPNDYKEKAYWRENLNEMEKKALANYEKYISNVYEEMIKASVISIKGIDGDVWENLEKIRPDQYRIRTISELVLHTQRISLVSQEGK